MAVTLLLGLLLLSMCGAVHFSAMTLVNNALNQLSVSKAGKIQIALSGLAIAHLLEAGIYAVGFLVGEYFELGGFSSIEASNAMGVFYFSLVNYTSLGLGDVYPTGHLRFIAGLESLNGFLLISCSASMLFGIATKEHGA